MEYTDLGKRGDRLLDQERAVDDFFPRLSALNGMYFKIAVPYDWFLPLSKHRGQFWLVSAAENVYTFVFGSPRAIPPAIYRPLIFTQDESL